VGAPLPRRTAVPQHRRHHYHRYAISVTAPFAALAVTELESNARLAVAHRYLNDAESALPIAGRML